MPGYRNDCPYCKSSVLSRDLGKHILRQHEAKIFVGDTLKNLHRDKYLSCPLVIYFDTETAFLCLADSKCIRKEEVAKQHFKNQSPDLHKTEILRLREAYPLGTASVSEDASAGMTRKQKKALELELNELLSKLRDLEIKTNTDELDRFFFSETARQALNCLSLSIQEEAPKPEAEAQTPPLESPEDDVLPLVEEKPVTKQELIKKTFADPKFVKEISTNVLTGQQMKIPELEELKTATSSERPQEPLKKRGIKRIESNPVDQKKSDPVPPLPPVQPPPPPPPPAPTPDQTLSDIQQFQKMSPWERFLKSNPTLSVQEQLQIAQSMGIRPDISSPLKIVQDSKVKRPIKTP